MAPTLNAITLEIHTEGLPGTLVRPMMYSETPSRPKNKTKQKNNNKNKQKTPKKQNIKKARVI